MNSQDFIARLKKKYPKGVSDVWVEDITKWLVQQNLTEQQTEDLYEYVAHQYKYRQFPTLADIIDIWNATSSDDDYDEDTDDLATINERRLSIYATAWQGFPTGKAISILKTIRHHIDTDVKKTRMIEKEFYYKYENLLFEHGLCEELKIVEDERMNHLAHVKTMIEQGKPYRSMFDIKNLKNRELNVPMKTI